jgi:hypothetical protein
VSNDAVQGPRKRKQAGVQGGEETAPADVAVVEPRWRSGWRARLLRAAWGYPHTTRTSVVHVSELSAGQVFLARGLFALLLLQLGPHLRGMVAVLLPLLMAWLLAWLPRPLARAATSRHVLFVADGEQARVLRWILGAQQRLDAAAGRTGEDHDGHIAQARELSAQLSWAAAQLIDQTYGDPYITRELAELAEVAQRLADCVAHLADQYATRRAAGVRRALIERSGLLQEAAEHGRSLEHAAALAATAP